jgi:hypothetical protein
MRFDIPDQKKLPYEMVIPIRWGDMDAMGHVNNTVYFRYFEIVRVQWLHSLQAAPNPAGQGPVIVNAFCNFIRQLEYPGRRACKALRGQSGPQQLRHVHHVGTNRPTRRDSRRRRREDGVGGFPARQVDAATGLAARVDRLAPLPDEPAGQRPSANACAESAERPKALHATGHQPARSPSTAARDREE